jgi:ankyrin repeat protein
MKTFVRALCVVLVAALAVTAGAQAPPTDAELAKGMRLVDEGDFEAAIATLGSVASRLQTRGGNPAEQSRANLYLAIAYLGLSQEQAARAKFLEALKNDRMLNLSPYEFPPKVIQAFEQAKKEAAASAPVRRSVPPTVFFEAVKQGDFAATRALLADDPTLISQKDEKFGATGLHWAALRGHQAVAALLIGQGADVNVTNNNGETPLQVAHRSGRPEILALMKPSAGFPAAGNIFDAVKNGDVATVQKLLTEKPDLANQRDTAFGASLLHWAALRGHDSVVELLLAKGANPRAANDNGETPLQVAERAGRTTTARLLRGALGSAPPDIFEAVRTGDLGAVNTVLSRNPAAAKERDPRFGATPLHWAALKGQESVADLLLANGADPRATNNAGETPLQVAERGRQDAVARLLRSALLGGRPAGTPASPGARPAPRPSP